MLDIQLLRDDINEVAKRLATRGYTLDVARFNKLDQQRKALQTEVQEIQNQRNTQSKLIGQAKSRGENVDDIMAAVAKLLDDLKAKEQALTELQTEIQTMMLEIPNVPHDSVPVGKSEADNVVVRTVGDVPKFDFTPKEHFELAPCIKGGMNFDTSVKLSGTGFVVLDGPVARLQRALTQFMLDLHTTEHGYTEK
ncbi:MAG TPA: serine--tRNA ligase, partial [Gammaproteobacteria bacterium]|nr:serine--tRNA ligase [Gammaproteobacteria bacterium]